MASHHSMYDELSHFPKLIAFDLDGTVWTPDMYQLWGGGAPFTYIETSNELRDRKGQTVRLLGISDKILHDLKEHSKLTEIKVAWVSCTDEPAWADECMNKFLTNPGQIPIATAADNSQIFTANKQNHFRNLKRDYPHIDYSDMLFFDNEYGNIKNVMKLGVHCVYCEDGLTAEVWRKGLQGFADTKR